LQYFNKQIVNVLPLLSLDLTAKSREAVTGLRAVFLKIRSFIFGRMKNQKFDAVLAETGTDGRPDIKLNRGKAAILRQRGKLDS
jgi:hypothetical protein